MKYYFHLLSISVRACSVCAIGSSFRIIYLWVLHRFICLKQSQQWFENRFLCVRIDIIASLFRHMRLCNIIVLSCFKLVPVDLSKDSTLSQSPICFLFQNIDSEAVVIQFRISSDFPIVCPHCELNFLVPRC